MMVDQGEMESLERAVLKFVARANYVPVKPKTIAKQLNVHVDSRIEVTKAVKRLAKRGLLRYGGSHVVLPVDPNELHKRRIVGTFRRNPKGFGFVRPSQTPKDGKDSADIYISPDYVGDAATGDVVAVELMDLPRRGGLGPSGKIVDVVERQTATFVGTYFEWEGDSFVQVDGALFAKPVLITDLGAQRVQEDDKVVFEMIRFPAQPHPGEGVIIEVLGNQDQAGVDTLSIIREFDLPTAFSEEVENEARRVAEAFKEVIPRDRLDLTALTIVTIDPEDARDFDDAISLGKTEQGHWMLGVHIADVAHFVRPGSVLDRESRDRGTSVYLPDKVIPMLPEAISNSVASLQPRKVRFAKTIFMEMTPEGILVDTQLFRSAIRSNRRLSYAQVEEFIADPEPWRKKLGKAVFELLGDMRELASVLRGRRLKRGTLELAMPEVRLELDRKGRVAAARVSDGLESYQIIEQFMLAANEAVAGLLEKAGVPFLRRVHPAPEMRKLEALGEFIRELGFPMETVGSRFELQRVLTEAAGRPERHAVNYAVLRAMKRAMYSPEEEGHFALASKCYCHFTSPIRRYPDLTIHRLLDEIIDGRIPKSDVGELVVLGEHCSDREFRADSAERTLTRLKLLTLMSEKIGEEMDGIVTGVDRNGLYVQGISLPAEGLLPIDSLTDDYYRFDRKAHSLIGYRKGNQFRLGDIVRVSVARVDIERRELDFHLVGQEPKRKKRQEPKPEISGEVVRRGKKSKPSRQRKKGDPTQAPKKKRKRKR